MDGHRSGKLESNFSLLNAFTQIPYFIFYYYCLYFNSVCSLWDRSLITWRKKTTFQTPLPLVTKFPWRKISFVWTVTKSQTPLLKALRNKWTTPFQFNEFLENCSMCGYWKLFYCVQTEWKWEGEEKNSLQNRNWIFILIIFWFWLWWWLCRNFRYVVQLGMRMT